MRPASKSARPPYRALLVLAFCALYLLHITGFFSSQRQESTGPKRRRRLQESSGPLELPQTTAMPAVAAVDVQQAISQAPPVHGYVPKSGPTKLQYWTSANRTARHQQFEEWIHDIYVNPGSDRATTIKDGMRMRNLPPMYPNCQVLVNHRYKFIYLRHPKSASSSIMTYFGACPANQAGASGSGGTSAGEEQQPLGRGAACLEPMAAQDLSPEEIHHLWQDYFVFTVVRNPYQRMLSSYKYLLRKTKADPGCRMVRWDDYCEDPMALGRMCQESPRCCPLPSGFYWHHVIDQGRCLETEAGEWAVDYVATVEQFDEQVQDIIKEINGRRAPELPPLADVTGPLGKQNEARGAGAAAKVCSRDVSLEVLQPEQTRVLVPTKGWVPYNATVLLDRHCDNADYFRGVHQHCLARAQHFYSTDLSRLYTRRRRQQGRGTVDV